ncbi:uncharacterized protein LOC125537267 [Triticum urartu]|uniref:uncharacterized protein LOC125526897 n=1 Tax=Triticum urartu TaxID=4572 RepID=UPI0020449E44|nr:uncharacterized protein LOC125526897 [Triticum urartu]XP_048556517.1 uncharacterized protein LOC125537267 [Triticum urartu]
MKHKDKFSKPSSAGRVAGKGLSMKWSEYYNAGRKERKTSSESLEREVQELKAQVAWIPEIVEEHVRDQLGATITTIMPTLLEGLHAWIAGSQQGPPPIPSFTGSNSRNAPAPLVSPAEVAVVYLASAPAVELNAPGYGKNTPTGTSAVNGPSVTCTPAVGGAWKLAKLDAITGAADVPCTLLHFVDGELIDVAKARIVQAGNRVFHGNPMPPTV